MTPATPADPVQLDSLVARLSRFVAARSLSGDEGVVADAVCAEIEGAGLRAEREGHNVWCAVGDSPRPRLLLNSHLDTVPAAAGWETDPWTPTLREGCLIGLGANDAKGPGTAMLTALLRIHARLAAGQRLGGTLVLALTTEEETTGRGLRETRPRLEPIDAALVGEPTGLIPMIAQRGLLILRCFAAGRTSHPANTPPETPHNAIRNAAADIARLAEFDWGPAHDLLGRPHAHVTKIAGGVAHNVIPDSCEFWLDVRTVPPEGHAALVARLQRHLASEVRVHSDRMVPVQTDPVARIVRACRAALPDLAPAGSATMSDMVTLADRPCVKIGPGDTRRSHTPNEYIRLDELAAGAAAYERIALEYFRLAALEP